MLIVFAIYSFVVLFLFNSLTHALCLRTEMSKERQPNVFRTINVLITILLITSYIEVLYT